jgi:hypothetical protein
MKTILLAAALPFMVAQADGSTNVTIVNTTGEYLWVTSNCETTAKRYGGADYTYQINGHAQIAFTNCYHGDAQVALIEDRFNDFQNDRKCWILDGGTYEEYMRYHRGLKCEISGTRPDYTITVSFE